MSLQNCLPLIVFVIVATVTPGGATTLAVASGAHFGYRRSLPYMAGSEIDFVDDLMGQAFKIKNPNAVASCGCGTSFWNISPHCCLM